MSRDEDIEEYKGPVVERESKDEGPFPLQPLRQSSPRGGASEWDSYRSKSFYVAALDDSDSDNESDESEQFHNFVFKKCFPEDLYDSPWFNNVKFALRGQYIIEDMSLNMGLKWLNRVVSLLQKWNDNFSVAVFKAFKPLKKYEKYADANGQWKQNSDNDGDFPTQNNTDPKVSMNIGGTRPFTADVIRKNACQISPVLTKIIKTIEEIDNVDEDKNGKTYKHSVFTNTAGKAGAKMMAAMFKAFGYYIPARSDFKGYGKNLRLEPKPPRGQRVALVLSSTAMGAIKTNQNNFKMAVLNYYNSSANNYGELAPVILLDSGFIEGTSLYNVKYAHIAEPPVSMAAFEQAVARSVRRCHSGEVPWVEDVGHVVDVFVYRATYGPWSSKFGDMKFVNDSVQTNNEKREESKIIDQFTTLSMRTAVDYYLNIRILEYKHPNFNYAVEKASTIFEFSNSSSDEDEDEDDGERADVIVRQAVATNKFRATPTNIAKFVKYILHRFDNVRASLGNQIGKGLREPDNIVWKCTELGKSRKRHLLWKGQRDLRTFFSTVHNIFTTHPNVRFFMAPVFLEHENCIVPENLPHLNMLIFDRFGGETNEGSVELFEPHGATEFHYDTTELQNTLERFIGESTHFSNYEFIPPANICPSGEGLQRIEGKEENQYLASDPAGWCAAWSFFYLESRLRYPEYKPQKLLKYLIKSLNYHKRIGDFSFTEFIRNYSNYAIKNVSSSRSRVR